MRQLFKPILVLLLSVFLLMACATKDDPKNEFAGFTAEQIFEGGERALADGKYMSAVRHFEALDAMYPYGAYSEQSHLDIIFAYYKDGEEASALAAADRFIRLYPRSEKVDYAYYLKGVVNEARMHSWIQRITRSNPVKRDMAYMREAFANFSELLQLFPNSQYAPDARKRMVFIRQQLAQQEIDTANFYLERKTYVAAANRASYVVKHYQGTPQVTDALGIMVEAYRALGENKLAGNSLQVLRLNYPNSETYKKYRAKL